MLNKTPLSPAVPPPPRPRPPRWWGGGPPAGRRRRRRRRRSGAGKDGRGGAGGPREGGKKRGGDEEYVKRRGRSRLTLSLSLTQKLRVFVVVEGFAAFPHKNIILVFHLKNVIMQGQANWAKTNIQIFVESLFCPNSMWRRRGISFPSSLFFFPFFFSLSTLSPKRKAPTLPLLPSPLPNSAGPPQPHLSHLKKTAGKKRPSSTVLSLFVKIRGRDRGGKGVLP